MVLLKLFLQQKNRRFEGGTFNCRFAVLLQVAFRIKMSAFNTV